MRKLILILTLALTACTGYIGGKDKVYLSTSAETPIPTETNAIVTATSLRVRECPSTSCAEVAVLPMETRLNVGRAVEGTGDCDLWYQIEAGYVCAWFVGVNVLK
jgi:hypothetical protein